MHPQIVEYVDTCHRQIWPHRLVKRQGQQRCDDGAACRGAVLGGRARGHMHMYGIVLEKVAARLLPLQEGSAKGMCY